MKQPGVRIAVAATLLTFGVVVLLIAASLRVTWLMFPGLTLLWLQVIISIAYASQRRRTPTAGAVLLGLFFFLACSVCFPLWILLAGRNVFEPIQHPTPWGVVIAFASIWPVGIGALVWDYWRLRQRGGTPERLEP
jgi:hypothetical protein